MSNEFTTQYAVRLPNGELFSVPAACNHGSFIFGMEPPAPRPVVMNDRAEAEKLLDSLKCQAAQLGITGWAGQIEQRTCSPFSVTDPSAGLGDEVEKWAGTQGGDQA